MDKEKIITHWSYNKPEFSYQVNDLIALKVAKFYSNLNSIDLVSLNLLDESFNYYYWFICKNTGDLYFVNLNVDGRLYQLQKDILQALSELNRYVFKQLNFDVITSDTLPEDKASFLHICEIRDKYYLVKNLSVDERTVLNLNKPSRTVRYQRRMILTNNTSIGVDNTMVVDNNSRKRFYNEITDVPDIDNNIQCKKKKSEEANLVDWGNMVAASSIRNFMLNDPLIDFLKEYNINSLSDIPSRIPNSKSNVNYNIDIFTKHIMAAGVEFENELIELIKKSHKVIKVADFIHSKKPEKFEETVNLMKQGVPIIYQGVLHDYENKTFGIPDLIVRSDYINKLMGYNVISEEEAKFGSPKLKTPYHYKIIDIKHSNIPLRADSIHVLNTESIPAYKGQIYIYMVALNKVLGIDINKGYIWGKKYTWESYGVKYDETNFLNKLGIIDYDNMDSEYVTQTKNAVEWICTLRNEGTNWKLLPIPCRGELFPNMKNEKDGHYRKLKNELNMAICEITNVWYCGIKRRQSAHAHQVYGWNDPKCDSKIMGFNPGKIASTVDQILDINRQNTYLIRPNFITYDRKNWKNTPRDSVEFYLDFETLNSNFGSIIKDGIISYDSNQFIFMIGVGYSKNNQWVFKTFLMKSKTSEAEFMMFNEFMAYIKLVLKTEKKSHAKMYHWSFAEVGAYNSFKSRHTSNRITDSHISFYDLNKVFINEPVTVHGALDFSLKTIAKALNKHQLIDSVWDTSSPCSNGLNAMILANNLYEKIPRDIDQEPIMKEIIYYNEIDCKVMWEIHNLIRENN
jgi:predicted RecB family nuclease